MRAHTCWNAKHITSKLSWRDIRIIINIWMYLCATVKDTKVWKWNFSLPSSSWVFAPCLASKPLPGFSVMTILGLAIEDNVGLTTFISSISSQRMKNVVLCPNKSEWNPIILADKKRRPYPKKYISIRRNKHPFKKRHWIKETGIWF